MTRSRLTALAAGLLVVLVAAGGCSTRPTRGVSSGGGPVKAAEDPWSEAVGTLRKQTDAATCRQALAQLNAGLAAAPDAKYQPEGLASSAEPAVRDLLKLSDADLLNLRATSYTPLDGQYLAECFYLRDVARTLGVAGLPPAQQAEAAFAWVCRQVVLAPWQTTEPRTGRLAFLPPVPAVYVLRRGSGSGLERGMVFLALLQQLDLDGCFVGPPDAAGKGWAEGASDDRPPVGPFWAVGVRAGSEVHLFDPWRGEPVPGTLAQVKAEPGRLKPWREDKGRPWDVPADRVAKSVPVLACPLPAAAPRFKRLEAELKEFSPVRLAADPVAARQRFADQAKQPDARFWAPAADPFHPLRLLSGFLPADEGGAPPEPQLYALYRNSLAPPSVIQLPAAFDLSDPNQLVAQPVLLVRGMAQSRYNRMFLNGPLDSRDGGTLTRMPSDPSAIAAFLNDPALLAKMEQAQRGGDRPQQMVRPLETSPIPRERVQRGQYQEVRQYLVKQRDELAATQSRLRGERDREQKAQDWLVKARQLFARAIAAQERGGTDAATAQAALEKFLQDEGGTVESLVGAATAQAGMGEATYLLAECMHELAEQAQTKADRLAADPGKAAAEAARADAVQAWKEARDWWGRYQPYAADQDRSFPGRAAHTRRLADRAAAHAGS